MLRYSDMASEDDEIPTYITSFLEAMIGDKVHEIRVMEPKSSVIHWMDLSDAITDVIRTSCPVYLCTQPLKVFFSSGPPDYADHYTTWLWNSLLVYFPDNKYLVHFKETTFIQGDCDNFKEFIEERFNWIPIQLGRGQEDSTTPIIGVFRDDEVNPDKAVHILHIAVGAFVVYLVSEKNAEDFDKFTQTLLEGDMALIWVYRSKLATSTSSETGRRCTPSPHHIGGASRAGTSDQGGGDVFT
jgi:hypothetical protein